MDQFICQTSQPKLISIAYRSFAIVEQARGGRDAWCCFNNGIPAHAIDDALTLRGMATRAWRRRGSFELS